MRAESGLSLSGVSDIAGLQEVLGRLVPDARLCWQELCGCDGFGGFLLDEESGLRPLAPEYVGPLMDDPPFWTLLWPAGEWLCRTLLEHSHLAQGRTVVDLGCGCGLVACAAALGAAVDVWAIDRDAHARLSCAINALKNGVAVRLAPDLDGVSGDLWFLADFLYDPRHVELLDELPLGRAEVVVVDSRLRVLEHDGFIYLGDHVGWAVPDIDTHGEFAKLRFWYRGDRIQEWRQALGVDSSSI